MRAFLLLLCLSLLVSGDAFVREAHAEAKYILRIATLAPANSPMGKEYRKLRRNLSEHTNGEVEVRMYSGGAAGDEKTIVRKMRAGQLDGAMLTTIGLGSVVRQVLILQAPGLITSYGELDRVRKQLAADFKSLFDKAGYELIAWGDAGRIRVFSKHRIERPSDMRSYRPWIWRDSPTMKAYVKATGANGVALGVPEVYPGLQTGMIDTVIASSIAAVAFQWHAALKTMSKQASGVVVAAFIIKKDRMEALPKAARDYIGEISGSTEEEFRKLGRKLDHDATQALAKRLTVVDLEAYQRAWDATSRKARESLAGRLYSKSLLERVQAIVEAP